MKQQLEFLQQEIEAKLKAQRELMQQFGELGDEETVCKLRILGNGYSDCLMHIKWILANH